MSAGSSSRRYWSAAAIVALSLCVAIPIWKSRDSVKPARVDPRPDTNPKVEIVPKVLPSGPEGIPALLPGDTCDKAEGVLGKPTEEDKYSRSWEKQDFSVGGTTDSTCHLTGISITVTTGHKVLTVDGITLGATTLADAEKILGKSLVEFESVESAEAHWSATLHLGSTLGMPFETAYCAYSDEVDALNRDPTIRDFRDLPITQYNLEMVKPHSKAK
jgi:hypothetical protein